MRRIAHLDMDAFYASVALLRYPQLKGLPVVIGGSRLANEAFWQRQPDQGRQHMAAADFPRLQSYNGRGVITTASYAARQCGVGSAMSLMQAAKLCPQAILLPLDWADIKHYSRTFKDIVCDIAPQMEDRGIDEVYIDFTHVPGGQREGGRVLARLIQKTIFQHTGLSCSIGVAPNKLLAKMASEFNKPNGIAVLFEDDLESKIWPLPCRKINGVGAKMEAKLQQLGIACIAQLAQQDVALLIKHFGPRTGVWLQQAAQGRDERALVLHSEPESVSRETTFARDLHPLHDRAELGAVFTHLCQQVAADLARLGYGGKTIGIKLRFDDFKNTTCNQTFDNCVNDAQTIRQLAGLCLKRVPLQRRLRLLGVRVASLVRLQDVGLARQSSLWSPP